jgi:hypothetical protein
MPVIGYLNGAHGAYRATSAGTSSSRLELFPPERAAPDPDAVRPGSSRQYLKPPGLRMVATSYHPAGAEVPSTRKVSCLDPPVAVFS